LGIQKRWKDGKVTTSDSGVAIIGDGATNNVAEWHGLLLGLEAIKSYEINNLAIYGDSELVIKQLNGECKVKTKL
jgi:ribonuclease HI